MILRPSDIQKDLNHLRENGIQRGLSTGFSCLDPYFTVKLGSTLDILAAPYSGKTEFAFDLQYQLSEKHGLKHLVYSPETGTVADIYAQLAHKRAGKPFYGDYKMDEAESIEAMMWVEEHFYVVDSQWTGTLEDFYALRDEYEAENGIKITTTLVDPWNEMQTDFGQYGGREDKYLDNVLSMRRRDAIARDGYNIICWHPRDQAMLYETVNGNKKGYYPSPKPQETQGGQAIFRKAMSFISMWRPPIWLNDEHGHPYDETQTIITIHKAKPKGVSERNKTKGKTSLFYDWRTTRFKEQEVVDYGNKENITIDDKPPF